MTRSRRDSLTFAPYALAAVPLLFLTVMLVAPALRLSWEGGAGFKLSSVSALWQDHYLRWRWVWSVLQAAVTCALVLLLGLPVAWVLARFDFMPPQYFREKSRFNDVETAFFYGIIGQLAKITLGGF